MGFVAPTPVTRTADPTFTAAMLEGAPAPLARERTVVSGVTAYVRATSLSASKRA